jgi:hypothetical protein
LPQLINSQAVKRWRTSDPSALAILVRTCADQSRFDPDAGRARQALRFGFDASASPPNLLMRTNLGRGAPVRGRAHPDLPWCRYGPSEILSRRERWVPLRGRCASLALAAMQALSISLSYSQ